MLICIYIDVHKTNIYIYIYIPIHITVCKYMYIYTYVYIHRQPAATACPALVPRQPALQAAVRMVAPGWGIVGIDFKLGL